MKILLVYPEYPDTFWSFRHALKFISKKAVHPPLGLLTIAAMLPGVWEKKLIDMNVSQLKDKHLIWADYVFIGAMAVQKTSVREIISRCKALGVKTVAGGPLFTASFEDYPDVDHLILNEAEATMGPFIMDLYRGKAKHLYTSKIFPDLKRTPVPLWNLVKMNKYHSMNLQYSRGCPFSCEFCDITTLYGHRTRSKSSEQVVNELDALYKAGWRGSVFFVDDNFIGNKKTLKEHVLPAMIEWMKKKRYPFDLATEASINLADDEDLIRQMIRAGFEGVFVGIETPDDKALEECNKFQNRGRDLLAGVKRIQQLGLGVRGGFIVGFDSDSPEIFEKQIRFIQESRIITAMVGMLNAPSGSKLYERLKSEGRLSKDITGDNTDFSTNIIPKMGYDTLSAGYRKVLSGIYSPRAYYERVKDYLREYKPLEKRKRGLHLRHVRYNLHYLDAPFKALVILGIKDRARLYYWKLLFWSLFRRPLLLPMAITFLVYGFHFRMTYGNSL
ncbi:MAG: B12-binding domain-containing radical SAM protein [Syntrophorhabdaceae bacterium]